MSNVINFKDIEIFDGKTYDQLLKDIYSKSEKKSNEFDEAIKQLIAMALRDPSSAANLLPLIVEYSEVSVKNDDTLVKIAGIIQRFFSKAGNKDQTESSDWIISDAEREMLLKQYKGMDDQVIEIEQVEVKQLEK